VRLPGDHDLSARRLRPRTSLARLAQGLPLESVCGAQTLLGIAHRLLRVTDALVAGDLCRIERGPLRGYLVRSASIQRVDVRGDPIEDALDPERNGSAGDRKMPSSIARRSAGNSSAVITRS